MRSRVDLSAPRPWKAFPPYETPTNGWEVHDATGNLVAGYLSEADAKAIAATWEALEFIRAAFPAMIDQVASMGRSERTEDFGDRRLPAEALAVLEKAGLQR